MRPPCCSSPLPFRAHLIALTFVCLLASAASAEESVPRRSWEKAKAEHTGPGPALWLNFPCNGVTYNGDEVRYAGCTEPGSRVTINGKTVKVYPEGAFAGMLPLRKGENRISLLSVKKGQFTSQSLTVKRWVPPHALPPRPLVVAENPAAQPVGNLELLPGETMTVRCQSVPGARAWFQIGKREKRYAMREVSTAGGKAPCAGFYEGTYEVSKSDSLDRAPIRITLEGGRGKGRRSISVQPAGTLTAGARRVERIVEAMQPDTGLYTDLTRNERYLSALEKTRLQICGQRNAMVRARLGVETTAWVPIEKVKPLTNVKRIPLASLRGMTLTDEPAFNGAKLSLQLETKGNEPVCPLPVRISLNDEEHTLRMTVYGLSAKPMQAPAGPKARHFGSPWDRYLIKHLAESRIVRGLRGVAPDRGSYDLTLTTVEPIWGYSHEFEGNAIELHVKAPPVMKQDPKGPLQGLTVVLDAGHGGTDYGALGSSGLRESDINMAITRRVARLLRDAHAQVVFTRSGDEYVTLEDRTKRVAASKGDLFLSIHCNSIAVTDDPFRTSGSAGFYFYPQGERLAQSISDSLRDIYKQSLPVAPVLQRDFRMTRTCAQMPAALVECLFISNPEDELLLLDPAFLDRLSLGIYKGMLAFLQNSAPGNHPERRMLALASPDSAQ